jgi:ABC-type uncharacterized transport system involved in gliding motility auxiliary subunit
VEGLTVKRALAILGWLGFALVAAAVLLRFTKPDWPGVTQGLAIAGLVVTVIYALSQWRDIGRSFEGKNVRYGSIAAGSVLVFVAILVAVNWLANRQNKRWDLTESKQFSLSDQTKQILGNLKSPLAVHVFHGSQDNPQRYRDRFEDYQYQSKQISVEYINAEAKPAEAEKYQITAVPTIVMEYAGRTQRATSVEEQAITNALKKLIEGKSKKAYFLQGHGERDPDDASGPRGYKGASNALTDENFEVAKLTLAQAGAIPADASLLVIAGPTTDVLPQEAELITAYVKNGGKVMLLIDPPGPEKGASVQPTSLIALAKSWGIQVGDDIVVDPSPIGRTIGTDASVPIGMPTQHPITANFRVITAFPLTRSVTAVEGGVDGKFAQSFVQTGEQSWAETDVKGLYATKQPEKNVDKGDKAGPISVAAAVSAPAASATPTPTPAPGEKPAPEAPKAESRLAVIGDSDFATNRWLSLGGNSDLFLNTANWLAQQEDLIAIRPRDPEDRRIELTEDQQTRILWITLVIIPLALFGNAFRVYWKRR